MKLGEGRIPPGGWHFEVASGVELKAPTKEILVKQIFEYRLRNNIEQGDIERDIDNQYCSRYPDACYKEPNDYGRAGTSPATETIASRVARWAAFMLAKMPRGGWPMVPTSVATQRAKICVHCPQNVPWRGSCAGCTRSTATILMQLKALRKTEWDARTWACNCTGWDNSVAVNFHADSLPITADQRGRMPGNCWRLAS